VTIPIVATPAWVVQPQIDRFVLVVSKAIGIEPLAGSSSLSLAEGWHFDRAPTSKSRETGHLENQRLNTHFNFHVWRVCYLMGFSND
jgi:hypothetical protein